MEAHHIIPVSLKDSFNIELDCKENLIPLCPNCHKAIHFAKNEYKNDLLLKILANNREFTNKFNLRINDLREIYFN